MGSAHGLSEEKILALDDYATSSLYSFSERSALAAADAITLSNDDLSRDQFDNLREHFDDDTILELIAVISWENASSKFNRALRVPSQQLWKNQPDD